MVNLEWYRSFISVYQNGTVTGAAEFLFLTQPAVSQHISALETSLSTKLFDRQPRKMTPTDEGKALYSRIISSMNLLESITSSYYKEKNYPRPLIHLGAPPEFFSHKVLKALDNEVLSYRIKFNSSLHLTEQLEKRKLDVIIATKKESNNNTILYKKLYTEKFILVQSSRANSTLKDFINDTDNPPSEALLLQQNWISYGSDLPIIRRYWNKVFKTRPAITPVLTIPDLNTICKAVELGKGISVLPHYICKKAIQAGDIQVINSFKSNVTNDLWVAYRKEDLQKPNIIQFINHLKNELKNE